MRAATQRKIDTCHAEIARLVKMEQAYEARINPMPNSLHESIQRTRIEVAAWPPGLKQRRPVFATTGAKT